MLFGWIFRNLIKKKNEKYIIYLYTTYNWNHKLFLEVHFKCIIKTLRIDSLLAFLSLNSCKTENYKNLQITVNYRIDLGLSSDNVEVQKRLYFIFQNWFYTVLWLYFVMFLKWIQQIIYSIYKFVLVKQLL